MRRLNDAEMTTVSGGMVGGLTGGLPIVGPLLGGLLAKLPLLGGGGDDGCGCRHECEQHDPCEEEGGSAA